LTDKISVTRVPAGTNGAPGAPGDDGVSPIVVNAQPESLTVQLYADGSPKPGALPQVLANIATQAGSTATITSVSITTETGGDFSTSGSDVSLDTISAEQGSVVYDVTAAGQTITKTVPFNTVKDGASGATAQTMPVTDTLTWTTYTGHGTPIAINASSAGKLRLNLTGRMFAALGDFLRFDSKIRISADGGGSWSDVSGSEHTSTDSEELFDPHRQSGAQVNGSGPYDVTGLTASGPYIVQVWDRKSTSPASNNSATCSLALYAEQIT
jgi:hypothetical protein